MARPRIVIKGSEHVISGLDALTLPQIRELLRLIAHVVGNEMVTILQEGGKDRVYPNDYPLPWESEKQRRYFFAMVSKGAIEIPYTRSNKLVGSWQVQDLGNNVVVGNPTLYAPYVQSKEKQITMHKDYWVTDQDAIDEIEDNNVVEEVGGKVVSQRLKFLGLT